MEVGLAARGHNLALVARSRQKLETLAEEVRPYGINVVTLCPRATDTNFFKAGRYGRVRLPGGRLPPEAVVAAAFKALERGGGWW